MTRKVFDRFFSLTVVVVLWVCCFHSRALAAGGTRTLSLTPEEEAFLASKGTLKVGYVQDRVPVSFSDQDGELAGISRYIFDHISKLCGIKWEYVPLPTGDVTYDYLLGEGFDLVTSVEYNEENQNAHGILISDPYFSSRKVVVAREDLEFGSDANLSVAVSTGSQTLRKVLNHMFPNFELEDYSSIPDCLDAVNSGAADLMIQNQYVVEYWISKPAYEKLKVIPIQGLNDQLCFSAVVAFGDYAGPSSEEGQILIGILNKAIADMTEDEVGTFIIESVMENQYTYTLSDFFYRYRYSVGIFFVSLMVILILTGLLIRQRIRYAESRADARAKGQFLSTMSHEIRTPLHGMIGLNYLMAQKLDDRKRLEDYLRQSTVIAKYLLSLVNDILDMSKLEARKLELVLGPVELPLLVDAVGSVAGTAMKEKKQEYKVHTDLMEPCVLGDEARIQQVMLNLLDNAHKFTPEGGRVELGLTQEKREDGKVLTRIAVTDTGCGISEDFQKHIFDAFSQDLGTVSKGNQGTGLGLSISYRLAKLMGGDLTFSSRKGEGSTFTFTFLASPAEDVSRKMPRADREARRLFRILVAEDNELNAEILMELLEDSGYRVDLAENGKKALQMFADSARDTYGLILMDLLMPEMDGFEAARSIRALDRPDAGTVRIFACTANAFPQDRDKALASGMDDFIAKPVDMEELLKKLETVLEEDRKG